MQEELFFKNNFEELVYLFKEKKPFALFLGAGVNAGFPEMMWDDLLKNLLSNSLNILALEEGLSFSEKKRIDEIISSIDGSFSVYQKAMFIKKVLGDNYIGYLQSHLYSNCNKDVIESRKNEENIFLLEIAKLILTKNNIQAVVTYNYDNFLTEAIRVLKDTPGKSYRQLKTVDIFQSIQRLTHQDHTMPIYHVHGFIPPPDGVIIEESGNVVLSIDEYFNNMIEPFSWQTTTQLFYLNNYNCLFLGASLDDWNMLRALSYSNHFSKACKHFVIFNNKYFNEGTRVSTFMNRVKASIFEDIGIKPIFTDTNNYKEINEKINQL
jgi:hypothetical protein